MTSSSHVPWLQLHEPSFFTTDVTLQSPSTATCHNMEVLITRTSCDILFPNNHDISVNADVNDTSRPIMHSAALVQQVSQRQLLQCLNDEKALLYVPVIVFLGVLVLTGTVGNTLVLCVYWRKSYKASSHYFILALAVLDLFSCIVGLPTEIADLRFPYLFDLPIACKLLRFTHSSTIIASSTILIQVAFDRYYRICRLGQQFSVRKAKWLCAMSIVLGVLTSWPSCLLFGRKTLVLRVWPDTRRSTHYGHVMDAILPRLADRGVGRVSAFRSSEHVLRASDCSTEDSMQGTIYPTIYYLFLFSLFFLTVTFFAVLYIRIGVAIWRRKRKTIGAKVFSKVSSHGSDHTSTDLSSETDPDNPHHHHHHHPPPPPTPYLSSNVTRGSGKKKAAEAAEGRGLEPAPEMTSAQYPYFTGTLTRGSGKKKGGGASEEGGAEAETELTPAQKGSSGKRRQIRVGKTTTVLFAVTLAYILSFLPYLVVMVLRSVVPGFEGRLSPVGEVAYKFCVKSFFINNAINPLIYSFLNAGFRKDARSALRKMWHNCCCRCFCCGRSCCCDDDGIDVVPRQQPIAV